MIKKEIRKHFKALRNDLSAKERDQLSRAIFDNAKNAFDFSEKKVSVFLPIERFSEVNTWYFINEIKSDFYLPVITETDELKHVKYQSKAQIKISDWGIPEPTGQQTISPKAFDYVLVPLLAIDKLGNRTGYGKGFYDDFLSQCHEKCVFIGLSYFQPIDEIEDVHENDVKLDICITPEGLIKFET